MDLFFYATEHDTFGIAVIEALASGLPVLVNDWDVMKEITCEGKYATLFRTDDIEDCLDRIRSFAGMRADARKITPETMEAVRNRYSIEKHILELNELYRSCC